MIDRLWLCGKFVASTPQGRVWEFQGIFFTEELARAACRDYTYWIAPVVPNEEQPHEAVEFEGGYFPIKRTGDSDVKEDTPGQPDENPAARG